MRCHLQFQRQTLLLRTVVEADNPFRIGFDRGLGTHFITFVSDQSRLVNFTKVRLPLFPSILSCTKFWPCKSSDHPTELIRHARVLPDGDGAHQTRHPFPVPPTLRRDQIDPAADDPRHDRHRVAVGARLLLHRLVPRVPGLGPVGFHRQVVRRQVRAREPGPEQHRGCLPRADVDEHGPRLDRPGHPRVVLPAAKTGLEVSGEPHGVVFSWFSVSRRNRSCAVSVAPLESLILTSLNRRVNVLSLFRLISIVDSRAGIFPTYDPSWYGCGAIVLAALEVSLATVCASLPVFWPVMKFNNWGTIFVTYEVSVTREENYVELEEAQAPRDRIDPWNAHLKGPYVHDIEMGDIGSRKDTDLSEGSSVAESGLQKAKS